MNSLVYQVGVIAVAGALGGIVTGLTKATSYTLRLPTKRAVELGFIGDALVGVAASIAVFSVAGPLLNIDLAKLSHVQELIKAIAVGILAGFGGLSCLRRLSDKLLAQVQETVHSLESTVESTEFVRFGDFLSINDQYEEAITYYDHALKIDPKSVEALVNKARALKRSGKVSAALSTVESALSINPQHGRATYNKACYKALLKRYPREEVLSDLAQAIEIFSGRKAFARKDPDFDAYKDDAGFSKLTSDEGGNA